MSIRLVSIKASVLIMVRGLSRGLRGMAAVVLMGSLAGVKAEEKDLTTLSIEELLTVEVISASRLGQQANQAPTSISVLTASDIRTFGWRTLAEALNAIRGLNSSSDRLSNFLTVRGFLHSGDYNSRILVMIDGQRMNENIYDSAHIGQISCSTST